MAKKYASSISDRANLSIQKYYLPLSWLVRYPVDRNGRVVLNGENSTRFVDLTENISTNGVHEKNRPDLYGVQVPNTEFYQSHFVSAKNPNKVIANAALDLYPLSGQRVKAVVNQSVITPYAGIAIVNYENLLSQDGKHIPVIRLQEFLVKHNFAPDITCFYELQLVLKDPAIQKMFTPRGLDQLAVSSYFIPNAIGETDANSRNILLVVDPVTGLIDSVIRIDADKNLSIYPPRADETPDMPKGIFKPNEPYNNFLGIVKSHKGFENLIDWELFAGYHELTKQLLKPFDITKIIHKDFEINQGRCNYGFDEVYRMGAAAIHLSLDYYNDFINNINVRVSRVFNDLDQRISDVHGHLPLEDSPYIDVDPFKTQLFDKNGRPIPVKDIPDGPIFY